MTVVLYILLKQAELGTHGLWQTELLLVVSSWSLYLEVGILNEYEVFLFY